MHTPRSSRRNALSGALVAIVLVACDDGQPPTAAREPDAAVAGPAAQSPSVDVAAEVTSQATIPLPINQSISSSVTALGISQTGTGGAGRFSINNTANVAAALLGESNGKGSGVEGRATGTGFGGYFHQDNPASSTSALFVPTVGQASAGHFRVTSTSSAAQAILGITNGNGRAGQFQIANTINPAAALYATTNGGGWAGDFVLTGNGQAALRARTSAGGSAGQFQISNPNSPNAALSASTAGTGPAGLFSTNATGNLGPALKAQVSGLGTAVLGQGSGTYTHAAGEFLLTSPGAVGWALHAKTKGPGWAGYFEGMTGGVYIHTYGGTALQVEGGSKEAVVATPSGARSLYTEESSEVWFTDYGFGRLRNGRARILIDPIFAQTVSTEEPYHVFLEEYGRADLYVAERTALGFVVALKDGDPEAEFSYRVVAKRRGFETRRLERAPWADADLGPSAGADRLWR